MADCPYKTLVAAATLKRCIFAITMAGLLNGGWCMARESLATIAPKPGITIQYLDDLSYSQSIQSWPGLVVVEFFKDKPSCSEAELMKCIGSQTNHFVVARVNLATNLQLAARLEAGSLGNIERGTTLNGKPIIVRKVPCMMTMLHGKRIDCYPERDLISDTWQSMERHLVEWLWTEVTRRERRYRSAEFTRPPSKPPLGLHETAFTEEDEPAIFQIAIEQTGTIERHNYQDVCETAVRASAYVSKNQSSMQLVPTLISLLDSPLLAESAAHSLAAYKTKAAPAVGKLIQLVNRIEIAPGMDDERSLAYRNYPNGVAALQSLGSIGPEAVQAAPALKSFAARQFNSFLKTEGNSAEMSGLHNAGIVAAIALQAVAPEPEDQSRQTARVSGTTWHLDTGQRTGQRSLAGVTVYFWREHICVWRTSDKDGKFDLNLKPGSYACSWTTRGDEVLRKQLFTPDLGQLLLFEFKAGANPPVQIAAQVASYD